MKTLKYTEDTLYSDGESVALQIEITPAVNGDSPWEIIGYTDDSGYHEGSPDRDLIDGLGYIQRDVNFYVEDFKSTLMELDDD